MSLLIEIVIGFIVAVIVYNLIHYFFITKPIDRGRNQTLKILNELVNNVLEKEENKVIKIHDLSDVWGRNIYAFEYIISADQTKIENNRVISLIRESIISSNNQKNSNHDIVLTDHFVRDDEIHIDLAYLLNAATYEYVLDMKKLKNIN